MQGTQKEQPSANNHERTVRAGRLGSPEFRDISRLTGGIPAITEHHLTVTFSVQGGLSLHKSFKGEVTLRTHSSDVDQNIDAVVLREQDAAHDPSVTMAGMRDEGGKRILRKTTVTSGHSKPKIEEVDVTIQDGLPYEDIEILAAIEAGKLPKEES